MLGPLKRKMMWSSNCSSLPLSRLRNLKSHFMIYDLRSTPERYLFLGSHDILGFDTIITQYSRYLRFGKKMRVNFRKCDISVRRWRTHCAPFATRRGCSQWGGAWWRTTSSSSSSSRKVARGWTRPWLTRNLRKLVASGNLLVAADPQSETWGPTQMHSVRWPF